MKWIDSINGHTLLKDPFPWLGVKESFVLECLKQGKPVYSMASPEIESCHVNSQRFSELWTELMAKFNLQELYTIVDYRKKKFSSGARLLGSEEFLIQVESSATRPLDPGEEPNDSSSYLTIALMTSNLEAGKEIIKAVAALSVKATRQKGRVFVLTQGHDGLIPTVIGEMEEPLMYGNYSEENAQAFDYISEQLKCKDPNGRITILNGCPGSGKTTYIKGLITKLPDTIFLVVPTGMVTQLDQPMFLQFLLDYKNTYQGKPLILVLEDADTCLVPRGPDNMAFISALLNSTDGILGKMFDLRVIATTNANQTDIDPAIMRPGRLLKHLHIGMLSADQANAIFERETQKPGKFTERMILAEIYAEIKGYKNEVATKTVKKVGFGS